MSLPDKRLVNDWLAGYLEFTAEQEAPESIHLWTGMMVLASAVRRKIYIEHEYYTIYPNLYIIIVAESAKVRKSTAMHIGMKLLMDAIPDVRIMRDSMTSQGLVRSLNHKVSVVKGDLVAEELRSDVTIFADEVANLFSYEHTRAATMVIFLTRTYDCPDVYDHTTVRDSLVRLYNLYPCFIGGTDPNNLKVLPPEAIGGLTGRLIWVVEGTRRKNSPGWKQDNRGALHRKLLREYLLHDLKRVANLHGEIQVKPGAIEMYNQWYEALSTRDTKDPETDAFYNRCHTTALRLAILKAVSGSDKMLVTERDVAAGIALVEQQLPEVKRVTMWSGGSVFEQQRARCINFLLKSGGVATRRLLLKHMGVAAPDFDTMITTLIQDGSVEIPALKVKNEVAIKLTREGLGRATS